MKTITERVGEQIREARKAKGLTQKEVGEKMGVTESTYNRYETGEANLSLMTIQKIADALDATFDPIFK
ncbi:helix-turn-helix domain-containing protein [Spirosoma pomorum]